MNTIYFSLDNFKLKKKCAVLFMLNIHFHWNNIYFLLSVVFEIRSTFFFILFVLGIILGKKWWNKNQFRCVKWNNLWKYYNSLMAFEKICPQNRNWKLFHFNFLYFPFFLYVGHDFFHSVRFWTLTYIYFFLLLVQFQFSFLIFIKWLNKWLSEFTMWVKVRRLSNHQKYSTSENMINLNV